MKTLKTLLSCFCFFLLLATAHAQPTNSASPAADMKMKPCFQCNGLGQTHCPTCAGTGMSDCPGGCLKLSQAGWHHMEVAGHPPSDIWFTFHNNDHTSISYSQNHAGHIIRLQNGQWADTGICPVCGGTTKVKCPTCKGTGLIVCPLCDGKKMIPATWTTFDNPKMKNRPKHFTLKNGRVLIGRKGMTMGSTTTIRTEKGDVDVETSDIVSEDPPSAPK